MKTTPAFAVLAILIAAVSPAAAGPTAEELVQQLRAPSWRVRQAAHDQIADLGAAAEASLKAFLAQSALPVEARQRATWLLESLKVPRRGAVWRVLLAPDQVVTTGKAAPDPLGLTCGDIAIAVDDKPITSAGTLERLICDGAAEATLTVWSPTKGKRQLQGDFRPYLLGFTTWPDTLGMFELYAKEEKWHAAALQSLQAVAKNDRSSFQQLLTDGCRDPVVLYHYLLTNQNAVIEDMVKETLSRVSRPVGDYPGGRVQYGLLPAEAILWRMRLRISSAQAPQVTSAGVNPLARRAPGTDPRAAAVIEARASLFKAIAVAQNANAWRAIGVLRALQVDLETNVNVALQLWSQYAPEILSYPEVADLMMYDLAMKAYLKLGPEAAARFVNALPAGPIGDHLKKVFATTAAPPAANRLQPMLIEDILSSYPVASADYGQVCSEEVPLHLQTPCRYEATFGPGPRWPAAWANAFFGIFVATGEEHVELRLRCNGAVDVFQSDGGKSNPKAMAVLLVDVTQPHTLTIDLLDDSVRAMIDGLEIWSGPRSNQAVNAGAAALGVETLPASHSVKAGTVAMGISRQITQMRTYHFAAGGFDNRQIESLHQARRRALLAGDIAGLTTAQRELAQRLKAVPSAAALVERMEAQLPLYRQAMSRKGLDLYSEEVLSFARRYGSVSGTWQVKNGWLQVQGPGEQKPGRAPRAAVVIPLPMPAEVEIVGVLDAPNPGGPAFVVRWNCAWGQEGPSLHMNFPGRKRTFGGMGFGGISNSQIDFKTPVPFCFRHHQQHGRFFARDRLNIAGGVDAGLIPNGEWMSIEAYDLRQAGLRVAKLNIRKRDGGECDTPCVLPAVDGQSPADDGTRGGGSPKRPDF
ncbi:MAG: hypothetical protein ABFD92_01810 [Planctomycetaceae bacterium]|nr:hypothetical protein [Planctomycetaceae bacterium]